jgi:predicted RNA-binding Zn ribbon-like protein
MRNIPAADHPHEFVGGALALDFTNTLGGSHRAPDHEHLQKYEDLVNFALEGGAISSTEARQLRVAASRNSSRAGEVLRRATALREALWRLFEAKADGRAIEPADLATANREIGNALGHAQFVSRAGYFSWGWNDATSLERPLWPIARSAADLISSPEELA